ncbi:MAG: phospholipase [Actinobacteria bacterium]|nr:phospholipase [Actinomycetota bacterium]
MDRREFLRTGALVGGAAYLGAKAPWALADPGGASILDHARDEFVDTIVVLMMENRSVDHYLGWIATDEWFLGRGVTFDGDQTQTFADPNGTLVDTYHLPSQSGEENPYRGCGHPDPGHGWDSGRRQMQSGFLAPGSGNDEFAVGYYQPEDVPLYGSLARRFTTFDRYHCSVLTSTFPNREYMHSAQSGGIHTNALPPQVGYNTGFTWDTIWDRLNSAGMVPGVDTGYFFVDLPAILLWGPRMLPNMQHIEDFLARAASGTLPKVCFVDPGFTTGMRTDDHPFADIRAGQKLVGDVVKAFVESPQWGRGVMFINYDEWGGFFDHVTPPTFRDNYEGFVPPGQSTFGGGFERAGFRTPTMMLSPHAQKGHVDHAVYDHTSILRFIEWRYLAAPATSAPTNTVPSWALTLRDANANNIGASLVTTSDPEFHAPLLPEVPVASVPCDGHELEGIPGVEDIPLPTEAASSQSADYYEEHAFEKALNAGFFERMGFTPNLSGSVPTL